MNNNEPSEKTVRMFNDMQIVIGNMMIKSEKAHKVSHHLLYANLIVMFINILAIFFGILYITNSMPNEISETLVASMTGLEFEITEQ